MGVMVVIKVLMFQQFGLISVRYMQFVILDLQSRPAITITKYNHDVQLLSLSAIMKCNQLRLAI